MEILISLPAQWKQRLCCRLYDQPTLVSNRSLSGTFESGPLQSKVSYEALLPPRAWGESDTTAGFPASLNL